MGVDKDEGEGKQPKDAAVDTVKVRGRGNVGAKGLDIVPKSTQKVERDSKSFTTGTSRSRSRSRSAEWWCHDKFDVDRGPSPERFVPKDYQPPKPRWTSRAGGVAIMRTSPEEQDEPYYDMR